jgi:hypothetical protein
MTALGYLVFFAGSGLYLLWFVLAQKRLMPFIVAAGLVALTCLLGIWLFPWLTSMKLRREK